jgi:hypothetical protein
MRKRKNVCWTGDTALCQRCGHHRNNHEGDGRCGWCGTCPNFVAARSNPSRADRERWRRIEAWRKAGLCVECGAAAVGQDPFGGGPVCASHLQQHRPSHTFNGRGYCPACRGPLCEHWMTGRSLPPGENPAKDDGLYAFQHPCTGSDYESMRALIETQQKITRETFARKIGREQWTWLLESLGYDRHVPITRDRLVGYYRGVYRGAPAVFMRHSGTEYIFTLEDGMRSNPDESRRGRARGAGYEAIVRAAADAIRSGDRDAYEEASRAAQAFVATRPCDASHSSCYDVHSLQEAWASMPRSNPGDESRRERERRARAEGGVGGEVARITDELRAGRIHPWWVEWAAVLGDPAAREVCRQRADRDMNPDALWRGWVGSDYADPQVVPRPAVLDEVIGNALSHGSPQQRMAQKALVNRLFVLSRDRVERELRASWPCPCVSHYEPHCPWHNGQPGPVRLASGTIAEAGSNFNMQDRNLDAVLQAFSLLRLAADEGDPQERHGVRWGEELEAEFNTMIALLLGRDPAGAP